MTRRRADDARVALLREILSEDIPHTDDSWEPPPKDEPPPELPKVFIRALVESQSVRCEWSVGGE